MAIGEMEPKAVEQPRQPEEGVDKWVYHVDRFSGEGRFDESLRERADKIEEMLSQPLAVDLVREVDGRIADRLAQHEDGNGPVTPEGSLFDREISLVAVDADRGKSSQYLGMIRDLRGHNDRPAKSLDQVYQATAQLKGADKARGLRAMRVFSMALNNMQPSHSSEEEWAALNEKEKGLVRVAEIIKLRVDIEVSRAVYGSNKLTNEQKVDHARELEEVLRGYASGDDIPPNVRYEFRTAANQARQVVGKLGTEEKEKRGREGGPSLTIGFEPTGHGLEKIGHEKKEMAVGVQRVHEHEGELVDRPKRSEETVDGEWKALGRDVVPAEPRLEHKKEALPRLGFTSKETTGQVESGKEPGKAEATPAAVQLERVGENICFNREAPISKSDMIELQKRIESLMGEEKVENAYAVAKLAAEMKRAGVVVKEGKGIISEYLQKQRGKMAGQHPRALAQYLAYGKYVGAFGELSGNEHKLIMAGIHERLKKDPKHTGLTALSMNARYLNVVGYRVDLVERGVNEEIAAMRQAGEIDRVVRALARAKQAGVKPEALERDDGTLLGEIKRRSGEHKAAGQWDKFARLRNNRDQAWKVQRPNDREVGSMMGYVDEVRREAKQGNSWEKLVSYAADLVELSGRAVKRKFQETPVAEVKPRSVQGRARLTDQEYKKYFGGDKFVDGQGVKARVAEALPGAKTTSGRVTEQVLTMREEKGETASWFSHLGKRLQQLFRRERRVSGREKYREIEARRGRENFMRLTQEESQPKKAKDKRAA